MSLRTLQLYGTASATGNAVAQVTVPSKSTIKGILAALNVDSVTDNGIVIVELSKTATSQIATNGALDPFFEMRYYSNFVTSGLVNGGQNLFVPVSVPCRQGEIIYLHATVSGTATFYFNAIFVY